MTQDVEEQLATVLRQRAGHEVDAHALLDGAVARGRRRQRARRYGRIAGIAGCAAVLAVVGGIVITHLGLGSSEQRPPFANSDWSGTVPDLAAADPPDEVWPEAVHRLPATLPDGYGYQVFAVLGGDRYLVQTEDLRVGAPLVFNARTGALVFLGTEEMRTSPSSTGRDWTTAVDDYAVWFRPVPVDNGARWPAEVWIARLDGTGDPKKIATVPDHGNSPPLIGVAADSIYWDEAGLLGKASAGIQRLPLTGGTPRRVPDSDGYQLFGLSTWSDTTSHFVGEGGATPREGVLWNVETGERRPWVAHKNARTVVCEPRICTGVTKGGKPFVQRLDGTGFRELPYPENGFNATPAMDGRFTIGTAQTSHGYVWHIWDLVDGKVASATAAGTGSPNDDGWGFGFEHSIVQWRGDDGSIRVLDLGAIG